MRSVCFVTNELYPVKPGGLGRLMYNFAKYNRLSREAVDFHWLLPEMGDDDRRAIFKVVGELGTLHFCSSNLMSLGELGRILSHQKVYGLDEHLTRSLTFFAGLIEAQRRVGREFDIVEFPDYGGWASATIAAKRAGMAFQNTIIVVRLHSTMGVIMAAEPFYHRKSQWMAAIMDLERQTLRDADLVVGHLDCICDYNSKICGFDKGWRSRVVTEFPPILVDRSTRRARKSGRTTNFVFSSRLQPFKRPDTFIRAAVRFLREDPTSPAIFTVASYGWDEEYISWLKSLIPTQLEKRIVFRSNLPSDVRDELLGNAIVILPSDYESLCLAAYESAMLGAKMVLNRICLAFGQGPRWHEGRNCLMFDGTFIDLARVMKDSLTWQPTERVDTTSDALYWQKPLPKRPAPATPDVLGMDILSYGFSNLAEINAALVAAMRSGRQFTHYLLVPRPLLEAEGIDENLIPHPSVRLHLIDWLIPTPTEVAAALAAMDRQLIAFRPSDVRVDESFLKTAKQAMELNPSLSAVTSHTVGPHPKGADDQEEIRFYAGDLPTIAAGWTRICHRASVLRREAVLALGLSEQAGDRWFEDLCGRLVDSGAKILCLPMAPVREAWRHHQSRLSDEVYFATRQDQLGLRHGLAVRLRDLNCQGESDFETLDPRTEGQEIAALRRTDTVIKGIGTFAAVIIRAGSTDQVSYRDITMTVIRLRIGRQIFPSLSWKLAIYEGAPQLELRAQARALFESWPPTTSDQWGPLLEFCPLAKESKQRKFEEALSKLPTADQERLGSVVRSLPTLVQAAENPERIAREIWLQAAEHLRDRWDQDRAVVQKTTAPRRTEILIAGVGSFTSAVIHRGETKESDSYRDITVTVNGLRIGTQIFSTLSWKLAIFKGAAQLDLREPARTLIDSWPPITSDQWGPLLEYCALPRKLRPREAEEALSKLPLTDLERFGGLVRSLPALVQSAENPDRMRRQIWVAAAKRLRDRWSQEHPSGRRVPPRPRPKRNARA
jgi:glycosyltransferase involved in cell wall biosynthesis